MLINKRSFLRTVKGKGWTVVKTNADFRTQDCTLYWNVEPVISLEKDGHRMELLAVGDIIIYGKRERNHFVYKGGNPSGKLTSYLRANGLWENNNWFEINQDGSSYQTFETPFYILDEAVGELLSRL